MRKRNIFEKSNGVIRVVKFFAGSSCIFLISCMALTTACKKSKDLPSATVNIQSAQDKDFVQKAAFSNNAEVKLGNLASQKGSSSRVRSYGAMMVNDHTLAKQDLNTLGQQKNLSVPPMDSMDAQHITLYNQLQSASGRQFDSIYINSQVTDHTKAISDFNVEASQGHDNDIVAYAKKYQPRLQMHLDSANAIKNADFK